MKLSSFDRWMLANLVVVLFGIAALVGADLWRGIQIRRIEPQPETDIAITSSFRITFAEPMNSRSVAEHFEIQPHVAGQFSWEGNTLIFTPTEPLEPNQDYEVSLAAGTQSAAGRAMTADRVWHFHTRQPRILYLAPASEVHQDLWIWSEGEPSSTLLFAPRLGIYDFNPSPDGSQIAAAVRDKTGYTDIWLVEADGTNAHMLIDCKTGGCDNPVWSPDRSLLAYQRYDINVAGLSGSYRIWLYDFRTGETAPIYEDNQVLGMNPLWSANGEMLAFYDVSNEIIRVVRIGSGEIAKFASNFQEMGAFSPDGTKFAYPIVRVEDDPPTYTLRLAALEDGTFESLFESTLEIANVTWSPDGRWLAFALWHDRIKLTGGAKLVILNAETGVASEVEGVNTHGSMDPQWDPHGQHLLLRTKEAYPSNFTQLWRYDPESRRLKLIVEDGVNARWFP